MRCSQCNSTMTCLFISWVCDTCNPPGGQNKINSNELYYGWVPFGNYDDETIVELVNKHKRIYAHVFETKELAVKAAVRMRVFSAVIKKVVSNSKINYDNIDVFFLDQPKTYLVPHEDLDTKQDGFNIVSVVFNKEKE